MVCSRTRIGFSGPGSRKERQWSRRLQRRILTSRYWFGLAYAGGGIDICVVLHIHGNLEFGCLVGLGFIMHYVTKCGRDLVSEGLGLHRFNDCMNTD